MSMIELLDKSESFLKAVDERLRTRWWPFSCFVPWQELADLAEVVDRLKQFQSIEARLEDVRRTNRMEIEKQERIARRRRSSPFLDQFGRSPRG